jgi:hypothetical protein
MSRIALFLAGLGMLLAASCTHSPGSQAKVLTERQRDSVLAASKLPGSAVVGKALVASDSGASHAAALDSVAH